MTTDLAIISKGRLTAVALFSAVISFLSLFVVWYVARERFIYFWDYVEYHNLYISLGPRFEVSTWRALHFVFNTVRESDYNSLPVLFLMPFRFAFGPGRLAFLLSVAVTSVFPSIALFPYVVRKLARRGASHSTFDEAGLTLLSVLGFAFLPLLWAPVLLGSVDAGGLIIILLVLMLYFRADLVDQNFQSLVSMALLLCLLVLYRRWYAYWVVGFFAAMAACEGLKFAMSRERRAHFSRIAINIFTLGGVSSLSFLLIATPIARKMMTTNYRDIYSAYRSSRPLLHNLAALYEHFGLLTLALAGLGIVLSGMNEKRRPVVYFLCIQFGVTFVLFARTQDFVISSRGMFVGTQHFYWALATLALFLVFAAQDVFLSVKGRAGKVAVLVAMVAMSLANFCGTFLPRADRFLSALDFALPSVKHFPLVRTDLDRVQALLDALSDIDKDSESTIYILASSYSLNSSIAHEACFHLEPSHRELAHKIAPTNDVDKRDGFPTQFLKARYVVLTLPFAYHLAPEDQRVIGVLSDELVKRENIGKSYDKLNYEFRLEDGSTAFIYQKSRPLDPDAVKSLSDEFVKFYPNDRDKFEIPPGLIREVSAL